MSSNNDYRKRYGARTIKTSDLPYHVTLNKNQSYVIDRDMKVKRGRGYMSYGGNDMYPNLIENLINNSPTGKASLIVLTKFLVGKGFVDQSLNDIIVGYASNGRPIKMIDLLRWCAQSVGKYKGAAIHANKNIDNLVTSVRPLHWKQARIGKPDDSGYYPDIWYKKSEFYNDYGYGNGKNKFSSDDFVQYPIFTNDPATLNAQLESLAKERLVNKIEAMRMYKGQILHYSFDDHAQAYPLSPFDAAYLDLDTEYQLSLKRNRELRNGFFGKKMITIANDQRYEEDPQREGFWRWVDQYGNPIKKEDMIVNQIYDFIGADHSTAMVFDSEMDEETGQVKQVVRIDDIPQNIDDGVYQADEKSIKSNIRKAAYNLPDLLIENQDASVFSSSGEAFKNSFEIYNEFTADLRKELDDMFAMLFKNVDREKIKLPENPSFAIEPLNIDDNGESIDA